MSSSRAIGLALVAFVLAACTPTPPPRPSPSSMGGKPNCPGTPVTGCLTEPVCSYDRARDCNACACGSPYGDAPPVVNPEGVPPPQ